MKAEPLFELSGGHAALDFTNTVDNRPAARRRDFLHSCADLISWARQAGLLSAAQAGELSRQARRAPARARGVLRRAVALREALYETLSARAASVPPPPQALKRINVFLPEALKRSRIVRRGERFDWEFSAGARLFFDRSRNRSRRWCNMQVCGNRDKVRRFRRRQGSSR
jgi:predicted RNA-binding Zn ribbon-like protein